jgi:hypothetical protein
MTPPTVVVFPFLFLFGSEVSKMYLPPQGEVDVLVAEIEVGATYQGFELGNLVDDVFLGTLELDSPGFDDRVERVEEGRGRLSVFMGGLVD